VRRSAVFHVDTSSQLSTFFTPCARGLLNPGIAFRYEPLSGASIVLFQIDARRCRIGGVVIAG
jgi:hypothetical protein